MRVYLVQHGLAAPESLDPQRGLCDKGVVQTQSMAEAFCRWALKLDAIWHSQKLRSIQTAQIFCQYISVKEIMERDDLNPQDRVDEFPQK